MSYCGTCGGFYSPECGHASLGLCSPAENPFEPKNALAIDLLEKEIARLNTRVQELLECNNAYLQRARDAEAKLKDSPCSVSLSF